MCQPTPHDVATEVLIEVDEERPLGLAGRCLVGLVRLYQWTLRPLLGGHCRFIPSCSEYSILAIRKHGAWRGAWMTAWRILRCQPFCRGGIDHP